MIAFLGRTYYLHATTANWQQVPAQVMSWDLKHVRSGKSTQTKLIIQYRYQFNGQTYQGDRPDFSMGADNFSGVRRSRQISDIQANQLKVFVDPQNPAESVMDRSLPIQQVAFVIFFLFFPCGLGTAFGWGLFLQAISRVTALNTDRWYMPGLGLLHGLPALYPLIFATRELSSGSIVVLLLFTAIFGWSLIEMLRRLLNPRRGTIHLSEPKPAKPLHQTLKKR